MIVTSLIAAAIAFQPTPQPDAVPAPAAEKKMACCEKMAKGEGCACCKDMAEKESGSEPMDQGDMAGHSH